MNRKVSAQDFLEIIDAFLNATLGSQEFCLTLTQLWMLHRDGIYSQEAKWPERLDLKILDQWQSRQLTDNEFELAWESLYQHELNAEFRAMIDKIHSACAVFSPCPSASWEIGEEELRRDVKNVLVDYEHSLKLLALPT